MARKRKQNHKQRLSKVYYNTKHNVGFTGKRNLIKHFKGDVNKDKISEWLSSSDTYTLHKPVVKKFQRRKFVVSGIDALWQCDLTDLQQLANDNDGHKYILLVIDVFSRWACARVVKSKSGSDITKAFQDILDNEKRAPNQLQTDKGKEFLNTQFQTMLKKYKIDHYVTENQEIKASLVERLQRTIKTRLFRYFTHSNSYRYVDVIQNLIKSYNDTIHSGIGMKPNEVNYENQEELWQELYYEPEMSTKFKFDIGDRVRISKYSTVFGKGYLPLWSEEVFTISRRHRTNPPVYSLKDDSGSELTGTWYEPELQRIIKDENVYKIEKILSTRKLNGKTQYLVRWAGYPPSFDSYVNKSDLIQSYKN